MFEPLLLTDMVLALLAMTTAVFLAKRAGRALYITAALVVARLIVTGLILTGGLTLADSRLLVQLPLAAAPVAWALLATRRNWSPARITMARHVAAVGVLLSGWWLYVPFGPQDSVLVLVGSLAGLAVTAGLSVALTRWRTAGPWITVAFLLVPAVTLFVGYQNNTAVAGHGHHHSAGRSVDQLTGPTDRTPDVQLTLTVARGTVRLASGHTVEALTFNGTSPGPQIRARQGQLVEVTLVNTDVTEGVTVHWHGVDVPNAEDGVPGVTQNAVLPGGRHVYRFIPDRPGTFWYHTHRDSSQNVQRGLFGSMIIDEPFDGIERTIFTHVWPGEITTFDTADQPAKEALAAGRKVLLRLINSSEDPHRIHLGGTTYAIAAIDGNAIQGATPLPQGTDLWLAAGGRYDVVFTMPDSPVTLSMDRAALAFSPDGKAEPTTQEEGPPFDALTYGTGKAQEQTHHDKTFDIRLDDGFGFAMGGFGYVSSSINGRLYPAVPMLMVSDGDRVKVKISNRSLIDHPIHLHGHRVRVLTRNGEAATGSPWWADTLNVAPGEVFEVEFTADNPGIWMDHCHNFRHGAAGMIMHLGYEGVSTPYAEDHMPE
jgi:FtsP/CotA-like multicopper oxidase with cupredoxin domain